MRKLLVTLIFLMAVAWNVPAQPGIIDRVVAVVGREMILQSDIDMTIMGMRWNNSIVSEDNLQCRVLEELLLQKLLLAQARIDSLSVSDDEVDSHINNKMLELSAKMGGEKAVEAYYHKPMYQIKRDQREATREYILTQRMYGTLIKDVPISPDEVAKAYKKMPKDSLPLVPTQYVLRQIVALPPESDAKFDVRERLLSIRERINKGEKFSTLAILYSEDGTARRGGELGMKTAQEYQKTFAEAAVLLKPGQVSPIVETEYGYHLIQMIEKESNDMFNVRHILLKPQYTSEDRAKAFKQLDSIADIVKRGDMTFEQAATKFSKDSKSSANGGLVVNEYTMSSRFEKDQVNPADYAVLRDMKPGDVSIPFETRDRLMNTQYKIIQLVELIPSHTASLQDDYSVIRDLAKQQQKIASFNKWIAQKQETTYIRIDAPYRDCKFERKGWVK